MIARFQKFLDTPGRMPLKLTIIFGYAMGVPFLTGIFLHNFLERVFNVPKYRPFSEFASKPSGGFFTVAGFLYLVPGIIDIFVEKSQIEKYPTTTGTLVGYREIHSREAPDTYSSVYEYFVGGQRYEYCFENSSKNYGLPEIGTKIEIYYNPDKPEENIKEGDSKALISIALGGIFFVIGVVLLLVDYWPYMFK